MGGGRTGGGEGWTGDCCQGKRPQDKEGGVCVCEGGLMRTTLQQNHLSKTSIARSI